jgi:hypothetical protein
MTLGWTLLNRRSRVIRRKEGTREKERGRKHVSGKRRQVCGRNRNYRAIHPLDGAEEGQGCVQGSRGRSRDDGCANGASQ